MSTEIAVEYRPTIDRVSTATSTAMSTDISVDITHSKQDPLILLLLTLHSGEARDENIWPYIDITCAALSSKYDNAVFIQAEAIRG